MAPFLCVVAGAALMASIPPYPNGWDGIALAIGGFAVTALLIVWMPWQRLPRGATALVVVSYCVSVALLRDATGGATAGFAPLLYLPVIWQALYARLRDVFVAVSGLFLTLTVPIVVWGSPAYPVTQWRSAILMAMVAAGAGAVINNLVASVRRKEALLDAVGMSSRRVGLDALEVDREVRTTVIELTGASKASIITELPDGRISISGEPSRTDPFGSRSELVEPARRAWESGEAVFVPDVSVGERLAEVGARVGFAAMWFEPIRSGDTVTGLLVTGWDRPVRRVPSELPTTMALLAREAGVALGRAALVSRIASLARIDELTGLPNRRAWDEALRETGTISARRGEMLSIAMMDLDHFKRYNDTFGHAAGDTLLAQVAGAWQAVIRPCDVLARWGGEEFALLLPDTNSADARVVIERLRAVVPDGQTFSTGVFTVRRASLDGSDVSWMVAAADAALYEAKADGRDRIVARVGPSLVGSSPRSETRGASDSGQVPAQTRQG